MPENIRIRGDRPSSLPLLPFSSSLSRPFFPFSWNHTSPVSLETGNSASFPLSHGWLASESLEILESEWEGGRVSRVDDA